MKTFGQFIKYGIVGISNTLLTAIIIWFLLDVVKTTDYIANPFGYVLGFINSYYWNKKWTFQHNVKNKKTFIKFGVAFVIAFVVQYILLFLLLQFSNLQSYLCQLISLLFYSTLNFLINKYYTFKA